MRSAVLVALTLAAPFGFALFVARRPEWQQPRARRTAVVAGVTALVLVRLLWAAAADPWGPAPGTLPRALVAGGLPWVRPLIDGFALTGLAALAWAGFAALWLASDETGDPRGPLAARLTAVGAAAVAVSADAWPAAVLGLAWAVFEPLRRGGTRLQFGLRTAATALYAAAGIALAFATTRFDTRLSLIAHYPTGERTTEAAALFVLLGFGLLALTPGAPVAGLHERAAAAARAFDGLVRVAAAVVAVRMGAFAAADGIDDLGGFAVTAGLIGAVAALARAHTANRFDTALAAVGDAWAALGFAAFGLGGEQGFAAVVALSAQAALTYAAAATYAMTPPEGSFPRLTAALALPVPGLWGFAAFAFAFGAAADAGGPAGVATAITAAAMLPVGVFALLRTAPDAAPGGRGEGLAPALAVALWALCWGLHPGGIAAALLSGAAPVAALVHLAR